MLFAPETPRWLARKGRRGAARAILERIGGGAWAGATLAEMEATLAPDSARAGWRDLMAPRMRRVLALGIGLAVFQQWCGINVVFNYAEEIFSAAGYAVSDILFNIVITGAINLAFTIVAMVLCDRWGRRKLMLAGAAGLAVVYTLIGLAYRYHVQGAVLLGLVLAAIAFYAVSLAPVTWVVISEIFPNAVRGTAMSIAVFALWSGCFTLTYTFPAMARRLGAAGAFWVYAVVCVAGFAFILLRLPETKGKTLEQVEQELA
jgi:sugar porter (SP) family MFS transporter